MKKYKDQLVKLYMQHEDFKDELHAVLNHPLMPVEFESAWQELVAKYSLHDHVAMRKMWDDRRKWISAYFKEVFCARMTTTGRSESMNRVLKRSFMRETATLHSFAKQMNTCLHSRRTLENEQTNASEV